MTLSRDVRLQVEQDVAAAEQAEERARAEASKARGLLEDALTAAIAVKGKPSLVEVITSARDV